MSSECDKGKVDEELRRDDFNEDLARGVILWMKRMTGIPFSDKGTKEYFTHVMSDGVVFSYLIHELEPGAIPRENPPFEFSARKNITQFLDFVKKHLPEEYLFKVSDLKEGADPTPVLMCLKELAIQSEKLFNVADKELLKDIPALNN
ncbi:unnamed protein product [Caenorhabditis auriculariae]|uniref:Calponin-homology (CH) domain-containing protein n=1 Tax=Caenorhabditis auriculariae TaxID=2777116 RepID=A0A8S1HG92_9PELO|nr:unnamed protein product [Caenorhabditis auriculariae]